MCDGHQSWDVLKLATCAGTSELNTHEGSTSGKGIQLPGPQCNTIESELRCRVSLRGYIPKTVELLFKFCQYIGYVAA